MNTKVETLEKSMVKLTIEVDADVFEKGMQFAYNKNKGKISIQGFRKGKAPRKLIEKIYGREIFYEDAANHVIPEAYDEAVKETELEVVSKPDINVEQMESGKPFVFTAEVAVKPEVKLGDYKGLKIEKQEVEVTEEDIVTEIDRVREQNARIIDVTDRPVADSDEVIIDFEGFVDGEAFEGGKGENYSLTIGSKTFIDTFEEQLIGKEIGEDIEVNVTFPDDYQSEALQGKPALFKVKINGIKGKELPEVDDEFAMDVSEFDTLDEYKADLTAKIKGRKEEAAKAAKQEAVIKLAVENATMEIADPMIDLETDNMAHDFSHKLQYQGINLEQYFQITGQNMVMLKETMKIEAETKIKSGLVLEAIAKAEGIEVSDDEVSEEINRIADMYSMEVATVKERIGEEDKEVMINDLKNQKALTLMVEAAIEE